MKNPERDVAALHGTRGMKKSEDPLGVDLASEGAAEGDGGKSEVAWRECTRVDRPLEDFLFQAFHNIHICVFEPQKWYRKAWWL